MFRRCSVLILGFFVLFTGGGIDQATDPADQGFLPPVISFSAARAADAPVQSWRFVTAVGSVRYRPMGSDIVSDWRPGVTGGQINVGVELEAGADSHALLTNGRDSITLRQSSRISLPVPDASGVILVLQEAGNAYYDVESRRGSQGGLAKFLATFSSTRPSGARFEVRTPYLVAVVKGTGFDVSVDGAGAMVSVSEGTVGVTDVGSGDSADVSAGQSASVGSSPGDVGVSVEASATGTDSGTSSGTGGTSTDTDVASTSTDDGNATSSNESDNDSDSDSEGNSDGNGGGDGDGDGGSGGDGDGDSQ